MNYPDHPGYSDDDYEGLITAGRATGRPIPLPSDEDLHQVEVAWSAMAFHNAAMDEGIVTAGWVPKPTVDPNRMLLPSRQEIAKLPRWARVAFAARCARRVLPLVAKFWTNAPKHLLKALDRAVSVAENAAASASSAAYAAYAAAAAAGDASASSYAAAAGAVNSLCQVVTVSTIGHLTAPARDFDRLCRLVEKEKWSDAMPVPPTVFGPMWEGPPPPWWTDDILANLPPEPASEAATKNEIAAPSVGAAQPK